MKPVKVKSKAQTAQVRAADAAIAGRRSTIADSEQEARELQRLTRALKRARGFALYFVRCNLPTFRSELLSRLQSSINRPIVEIELNSGDIVLDVIERKSKNLPENAVLSITGLEHLLPTENRTIANRTLQYLNLQRSAFQRLHRPLLFWVPEYAIPLLGEGAPDFWDWHSGLYEFSAPHAIKAGLLNQFSFDSTYWVDWSLNEAEKHDRILLLLGLLDEYQGNSTAEIKARSDTAEKLAGIYFSLGDYDNALRYLHTALQGFEKLGDKNGIARVYNNVGEIHRARGEYDDALEWYQKSINLKQQLGDHAGLAATCNNIASIHCTRGNFDHALKWLQKSTGIFVKIDDHPGLASTYNIRGLICKARGEYVKALEWYRKSVAINEQLGDLAGLAATYNNIASIHRTRGDFDQALKWFQKSADIFKKIGDRAGLATTLHNMGTVAMAQKNWPAALAYFTRGRNLFREIGLKKKVAQQEAMISEVEAKMRGERGA